MNNDHRVHIVVSDYQYYIGLCRMAKELTTTEKHKKTIH